MVTFVSRQAFAEHPGRKMSVFAVLSDGQWRSTNKAFDTVSCKGRPINKLE
jgi:hypothetical protein